MREVKIANNPLAVLGFYLKAINWLFRPELRPFLLMPLLINFLIYTLALVLGYHYINELIAQFIPDWLHWLNWLLWPLFFLCFFIAGFFTFTIMANQLAAPFYGKLAAKTLALLNGSDVNAEAEQPIAKVMAAEFNRVIYLGSRALPLLVLFMVPGLNVVAPFLWAVFGAWGMALEYLAFPLENAGVLFPEQKQLARQARLGTLSFGGLTLLGLTVPVLNILVAPAAVIAATIYVHGIQENRLAD